MAKDSEHAENIAVALNARGLRTYRTVRLAVEDALADGKMVVATAKRGSPGSPVWAIEVRVSAENRDAWVSSASVSSRAVDEDTMRDMIRVFGQAGAHTEVMR